MGFDAHQYVQCMLLDQLHMEYLRIFNHPAWKQLIESIRAFNEERSEMSLSLLAFSVAIDSDKHTFSKLDTNYSIMNFCRTLIKDFYEEFNIPLPTSTPLSTPLESAEQQGIITSVLQTIEQMRSGEWTAIEQSTTYSFEPSSSRVVQSFPRFLRCNVSNDVTSELAKFPRLLGEGTTANTGPATPQIRPRQQAP